VDTLTQPKGASPKHATGQPLCKSSRTSSPHFRIHLKPLMREGSQFTSMFFHPRIDGWIPLDRAVESQQFRSHRHGVLRATRWFQGATLSSYSMGSPKPPVWTPSWRRASKAINRRCALNVMIWAKTPPNVKVSAGSHRASTNVSSQPERFRMSPRIRCSSASVFSSLCSSACGERCDLIPKESDAGRVTRKAEVVGS